MISRTVTPLPARFYVDAEGRRLGAFAGLLIHEIEQDEHGQIVRDESYEEMPPIPEGAIEVPPPPSRWADRWDGEKWVLNLDRLKAHRAGEVDARYVTALKAGMPYAGTMLQIRAEDQGNISAMAQRATLAQAGLVTWPDGFAWRMADDSFLPLPSPAEMIALAAAAAAEVHRLRQVMWGHKDAIAALTDPDAVIAYDIEDGWE